MKWFVWKSFEYLLLAIGWPLAAAGLYCVQASDVCHDAALALQEQR